MVERSHTLLAKIFHWGFLIVFGYGLAKQVDEVEELRDAAFLMEEVVFALVFLSLLLARFIYTRLTQPTVLGSETPAHIRKLASLTHGAMYVSLAMLGATGLMIAAVYGNGFREGVALAIVLWLHEAFYWCSLSSIGLHVVGAIYHRCLSDGVWTSMVPVLTESADR